MCSSTRSDMVANHKVPNQVLPMPPVDNICIDEEVVESVNKIKCDDVFDVLFQMQNDCTENEIVEETINDNKEMEKDQEEMKIKVEVIENEQI
ncbi:hypothetical protein ACJMK2_025751 [Sinanodonta woodiana]|uniref:Uncharacterized protein n=1 Tax=Sinanodonta woodiana TaxID=1069815 RepID=A0ABD3XIZ5_SINWO